MFFMTKEFVLKFATHFLKIFLSVLVILRHCSVSNYTISQIQEIKQCKTIYLLQQKTRKKQNKRKLDAHIKIFWFQFLTDFTTVHDFYIPKPHIRYLFVIKCTQVYNVKDLFFQHVNCFDLSLKYLLFGDSLLHQRIWGFGLSSWGTNNW